MSWEAAGATRDVPAPPRRAGLLGTPVAHSLSPVMHEAAYRSLRLDWEYGLFECPHEKDASGFIARAPREGFLGVNITMPWKRLALRSASSADALARTIGGANVLTFLPEGPEARNTDAAGIVASLERDLGIEVRQSGFIVCGTGATAASACVGLACSGAARIVVMSRERSRAEGFCERLSARLRDAGTARDGTVIEPAAYADALRYLSEIDHVVDTTPLGMHAGDGSVLPADAFTSSHAVLDAVYGFGETKILSSVRAAGGRGCDGLGMLVEQAALSVEIWMGACGMPGREVDRAVMRDAALAELERRRNAAGCNC